MPLSVVYVCDEAHAARLAISLESWMRFRKANAFVIDFGLSEATRARLGGAYGVTVLERSHLLELETERRIGAYREKTLAAMRIAEAGVANEDRVLLLDTDIILLDCSFFSRVEDVAVGEVAAVSSAWDVDFTWTYRPEAEAVLREICGLEVFEQSWTIPNSGVVSAWARTWRAVCPAWARLYDRFLAVSDWRRLVRPGASPGDQEFLRLALDVAGCVWRPLHGSCNMQVSPERMFWGGGRRARRSPAATSASRPRPCGRFTLASSGTGSLHYPRICSPTAPPEPASQRWWTLSEPARSREVGFSR
jgi:hypothetical protein